MAFQESIGPTRMFQARQDQDPPVPPMSSRPSPAARPGESFGDADYACFEQNVQSRFGVRLCEYKAEQMQRRLRTLAQAHKYGCFGTFFQGMQAQPELRTAFLDTMTINVTELMRNPERFEELARLILPPLLARSCPAPLAVWSAGCSYGAEAYTLALLLHEMDSGGAHRVRGTDIDLAILEKAKTVCFTEADMGRVSPARREAHFLDQVRDLPGSGGPLVPRFRPRPHLSDRVQFRRHDLLADMYPRAEYHLIVCRNVLIYFTEEAKNRIYRGFRQALKPGGVLLVGGTERLTNHCALGFELIRPFFYRKPDS